MFSSSLNLSEDLASNMNNSQTTKSIIYDLIPITLYIGIYAPLFSLIFGFIGFAGNLFTYLQPELRSNTCCIYSLCGSTADILSLLINLLPNGFLTNINAIEPWTISTELCRLSAFFITFFPQLSFISLLLAIVDRYAATCRFTSRIHRIVQLKVAPIMISIAVIVSFILSIIQAVFYEISGFWCLSIQQTVTSIIYIIFNGLLPPIFMFIFVLLTYRNIRRSRQRVVSIFYR